MDAVTVLQQYCIITTLTSTIITKKTSCSIMYSHIQGLGRVIGKRGFYSAALKRFWLDIVQTVTTISTETSTTTALCSRNYTINYTNSSIEKTQTRFRNIV